MRAGATDDEWTGEGWCNRDGEMEDAKKKVRGMALSSVKETEERIHAGERESETTGHESLPLTVCGPHQAVSGHTPSAGQWFVEEAQTWHLWNSVFLLKPKGDP